MIRTFAITLVVAFIPLIAAGQKTDEAVGPIRASAAYAEVLLRKTEVQAELEAMLPDYTEENPRVIDARFEIGVLTRDIDRIYAVRPSETDGG